MNSHVNVHRGWMRNFAFKDNNNGEQIYCMFSNGTIMRCYPERVGYKKDYFDEETDHELLTYRYEKPFSQLTKELINNFDSNEILEKEIEGSQSFLHDFYNCLFYRNDALFEMCKGKFKQIIDEIKKNYDDQLEHSILDESAKKWENETPSDRIRHSMNNEIDFFPNYKFVLIKNLSKVNFINNNYGFGVTENGHFISPISPKLALLISKIDNNPMKLFCIDVDDYIDYFNDLIVSSFNANRIYNAFLFAKEENDLKRAKSHIKKPINSNC